MSISEEVSASSGEMHTLDGGSTRLGDKSLQLSVGDARMRMTGFDGPTDRLDVAPVARRAVRDLTRSNGFYARYVKPVFDRTVGLLLLVVFAPVLAAVAAAVRHKLGSPIMYVQSRVGRDGDPLNFVKFRTMAPDRRADTTPLGGPDRRKTHKTDADPRHTTFGRFLRKTTLDELPQLVQVVRGEMSLVGPRPELRSVVETKYEAWQHSRHVVKPGLTGLWQVTARQADRAMHEDTDIDLQYIENMSFGHDLRILLATPLVALGRDTSTVAPSVRSI